MELDLIVILGPTASGKTSRAVDCARALDAEIISGDSRQIYAGMDIGTGKDLDEYHEIPYHLIDIRPAGYKYNLHEYIDDFHAACEDIRSRGHNAILCGGTGLYIETALSGIRLPEVPANPDLRKRLSERDLDELKEILSSMKRLHNTTDVDTKSRAIRAIEICDYYSKNPDKHSATLKSETNRIPSVIIGIDIDRESRRERISSRLRKRLDEGMADEIRSLLECGVSPDDLRYYGLEYKFITDFVTGVTGYEEMISRLEIAIHQFAKRQMTWFRGMERRGFKIHWLPYDMDKQEFVAEVRKLAHARSL